MKIESKKIVIRYLVRIIGVLVGIAIGTFLMQGSLITALTLCIGAWGGLICMLIIELIDLNKVTYTSLIKMDEIFILDLNRVEIISRDEHSRDIRVQFYSGRMTPLHCVSEEDSARYFKQLQDLWFKRNPALTTQPK